MYDVWIYELVFCATCCVVVRWQEAPNTICTALHHFSARSKCSSRPNSHQKVLKRNRQKPDKKSTQWVIFMYFQQSLKQKKTMPITYNLCIRKHVWDRKNGTYFSPRTVAGSPSDQCPHNGAHSERTTETFGRAAAKANGNLLPQINEKLHGSTLTEHEWKWRIR